MSCPPTPEYTPRPSRAERRKREREARRHHRQRRRYGQQAGPLPNAYPDDVLSGYVALGIEWQNMGQVGSSRTGIPVVEVDPVTGSATRYLVVFDEATSSWLCGPGTTLDDALANLHAYIRGKGKNVCSCDVHTWEASLHEAVCHHITAVSNGVTVVPSPDAA